MLLVLGDTGEELVELADHVQRVAHAEEASIVARFVKAIKDTFSSQKLGP